MDKKELLVEYYILQPIVASGDAENYQKELYKFVCMRLFEMILEDNADVLKRLAE